MSLPSSGQISISSSIYAANTQISNETVQYGKAINYSLSRLSRGDWFLSARGPEGTMYAGINQNSSNKPNRATQHSMSEFFSYNHTQNGACSNTAFQDVLEDYLDKKYSYHRINVTGQIGDIALIDVYIPQAPPGGGGLYAASYEIHIEYPFNVYGDLVRAPEFSGTSTNITSPFTITHSYTMTTVSQIFHIIAYTTTPIL